MCAWRSETSPEGKSGGEKTYSVPWTRRPHSTVRKSETMSNCPLPLGFGVAVALECAQCVFLLSFWKNIDSSCVIRMRRKRPPATGKPVGRGRGFPSLFHLWKRFSYSFQRVTNMFQYRTTSSRSCLSIYILFSFGSNLQSSLFSQLRAVLLQNDV